jgi:hypothetical protein
LDQYLPSEHAISSCSLLDKYLPSKHAISSVRLAV